MRSQHIQRPRGELFEFFADARNLERITPTTLRFRVLTPGPIEIAEGTLIDYRLSLFGIPFSWRTRIETWVPGITFVDRQLRGPYRRWVHTHTFGDVPGGTRMDDRVEYELPLGTLGDLAAGWVVRRQVEAIFDHRRAAIERLFPNQAAAAATPSEAER
jgi:ligand-binding SRPBCC domain-containing protein